QIVRRQLVDDDKRTDEHRDADEREDERGPDVQNEIHYFPPVKRRKPPYTGRYDPGLSRTDLGTVRASLNDVSRQPRYSAAPIRPTTTSPYRRYNLVIILFVLRWLRSPVIAFLPPATLEHRRAPRRQNRRHHNQHQRDDEPQRCRHVAHDAHAIPHRRCRPIAFRLDPEKVAAGRNGRQRHGVGR